MSESKLKIGVIGVLSGPIGSSWGIDAQNGINLAVEQIEKENGIKIIIYSGDSAAKPEQGLSEFKKIEAVDNPDIYIVETSGVASAIAPIATDYNKPILFTATAAEKITEDSELLFRNFYICDDEAPLMADKAFNDLNIKSVVVFYQKDPFGESCSRIFVEAFEKIGGSVISKDGFLQTDTDFKTQLLKVKESNFDAIYAVGYENQMLGIVKQMNEMNIRKTILGGRLIYTPAIRKEIISQTKDINIYFSGNNFYLDYEPANKFRAEFMKKYNKEPSHVAAYAYDSVLMIARAYEISKTKNISLKEALKEVKITGANGETFFNNKREVNEPLQILTINSEEELKIVN